MTKLAPGLAIIVAETARRKHRLDRVYIRNPEIDRALERIDELRRSGFRGPDGLAFCALVVGPTNTGKTRLFRKYCDRPDAQPDGDRIPVLRFTAPSPFNDRDFLAKMLLKLGTRDFAESHRPGRMKRRVVDMLAARQTELILIEETQHIIDKKGGNSPYWAADMIKECILDDAKVPIVFNGINVTKDIFTRNTQLLSRRKGVFHLEPDDWANPLEREQFRAAVNVFECAADFPEKATVGSGKLPLDSEAVAERIWRATGGLRGSLYTLFAQATELGVARGDLSLSVELLSEANAILSDGGPGWINMFTVKVLPPINVIDESRVTKLVKRGRAT